MILEGEKMNLQEKMTRVGKLTKCILKNIKLADFAG